MIRITLEFIVCMFIVLPFICFCSIVLISEIARWWKESPCKAIAILIGCAFIPNIGNILHMFGIQC